MASRKKQKQHFDFRKITNIQKIILGVCFLLFLWLATSIIQMVTNQNHIDYPKADADYFLEQGTEVLDREIYWTLNDIISQYIHSYRFTEGGDGEYTPSDYYKALSLSYQSFLGKRKYQTTATTFFKKFEIDTGEEKNMKVTQIISSVYQMKENEYFCQLSGTNDQVAYIGILLKPHEEKFEIFYIE